MPWFRRRQRQGKGTDVTSEMVSTPTGIFRFLGGRRHVVGVPYTLPKDDQEISRLDFQHYMLRYALRGNYAAPLGQLRSVLDVGTGSGRWAVEMAQLFPRATVVGLDVVPPPADETGTSEARPANYTFQTGNVLEGLPFADASFDFTHQRLLIGALPAERWPAVVRELARVTRPGGWVELIEANIWPEQGGPALDLLSGWVYEAVAQRGIDVRLCSQIGSMLRGAGLSSVEQREIRLPLGGQQGRLGHMMEINHLALFEGLKGFIISKGLTTPEGFEQTMTNARADIEQGNARIVFYIAYGRRVA